MKRVVRLMAIFSLLSVLTGCVASSVIAPGVAMAYNMYVTWKNGEATKYYHYDTIVVHRAVCLALRDMELTVNDDSASVDQKPEDVRRRFRHKQQGASKGFQMSVGTKNRFKIKIQPVEPDICRLKVRIDFWGDKPYVELLYQKVDEYLNVITFGANGKPQLNEQRSGKPIIPHLP